MWGRVGGIPLFMAAAGTGAGSRDGGLGWILATLFAAALLFAAAVLERLGGLVFGLRGVARQIGGWSVHNLPAGPPPMLPLPDALIGALGLIAARRSPCASAPTWTATASAGPARR
jgi:hypothetical protein